MAKDRESGGTASFGDLPGARGNTPKWEDKVNMLKYPEKKWVHLRLVGKLTPGVGHWLKTKNNKNFFVLCHNFNIKTGKFDKKVCPVCKLGSKVSKISRCAWSNAIVRRFQKNGEENPVRVVKLPQSVIIKIKDIIDLFNGVEPNDPKKGYDISVLNNPFGDPVNQYNVQKGDKTKLTDDEKAYELAPLHEIVEPIPIEEIESALERFGYTGSADDEEGEDDDEDGDDEDEKPKKKKSKKDDDDDDEGDDEEEDGDDEEDDEDEKPKKKSKKDDDDDGDSDDDDDEPKKKKKGKSDDDDDDDDSDDDDGDDEEEDEDEKPKKKSKKDDDDDEEEEEDDDEDEKPKKKKSKKDDDDDDEGDDEEEDDDDKPKKKKGKSDDDEEEEEDDEDEKPKKKGKKDDDDEDDWDEWDSDDDDEKPKKKK